MTTIDTDIWADLPPLPHTAEETGLRLDLLTQQLLKTLNAAGDLVGTEMADALGLPYSAVDPAIESLKVQRLCEIVGGSVIGPPSYRYRISSLGRERALSALANNMYIGPAPVPLRMYSEYMRQFAEDVRRRISMQMVREAFSHLVLSEHVLDQLGPAVNSGHSLFIYGPPGNGKTVVAQAIGHLMSGDLWIPHAIEVDGAIIKQYDPINHQRLEEPGPGHGIEAEHQYDRRWVRCRRPVVTVGGELTMDGLDLTYSRVSGFYRAPMQMLANGGVLVIDDFGRQRCSPQELLNRWIHPLESRVDYLTLQSGQKIDIPFLVLPVFATNIKPAELVDEAFLRRIQYKIFAENPTAQEFEQIFKNVCREKDLVFDPAILRHIVDDILEPRKIPLRGCQPRDLINMALALAQYRDEPRHLTVPLLEAACASYFVDEDQGLSARR
jgi:predicted ATPase with chaperone activity